jgi:hypothetical protein
MNATPEIFAAHHAQLQKRSVSLPGIPLQRKGADDKSRGR